jgi:hypothetical protein
MNEMWLAGLILIGLTSTLLIVFTVIYKFRQGYQVRRDLGVEKMMHAHVASMESGKPHAVILGHQLLSRAYPGLGLHSLTVLPVFLDPETPVDGGLTILGSEGSLVTFARQIVQERYKGEFSLTLHQFIRNTTLPGPTPFSFTAAILPMLSAHPHRLLALFGNYGPEALLWVTEAQAGGGQVFSAAGSLASQASLFLQVRDVLIGETVFLLPGLIDPSPSDQAAWLTEDVLRTALIVFLIVAAILKMIGVL